MAEENHGNTRLPFGLCKRYGIELPEGATPRDAWNALKGKGITPENAYKNISAYVDVSERKGKGYVGKSMSVNAQEAYGRNEKPLSKWGKEELLDYANDQLGEEKVKELGLDKVNIATLRSILLRDVGWHHVGALYNTTRFYSFAENLQNLDKETVEWNKRMNAPKKTDGEKKKIEEKKNEDAVDIERKVSFIADAENIKRPLSLLKKLDYSSLQSRFDNAISSKIEQTRKKVEQWKKLPKEHSIWKDVKSFEENPKQYVLKNLYAFKKRANSKEVMAVKNWMENLDRK